MTHAVKTLLAAFESLPPGEQRDVAVEILRRADIVDESAVGDEELVSAADEVFLQLDRDESSS